MPGKFAKVDDWYTQTAKEFRQDVRKTISVYWANSWIAKVIKTRTGQGVLIVGGISLLGVLIKGEPQTPIYETIFDNLESIALGSAGVIFLIEIQDRKKRDQYEAWQIINLAQGKTGSGGRIQALQDLNKDGVSLEGIAAPRADLTGIDLSYGKLAGANFRKTRLMKARLKGASLIDAHLEGADLISAHLEGAKLGNAHLEGANLIFAHLEGAYLVDAHLEGARLTCAHLEGAKLGGAHLEGANLSHAHLEGADLIHAYLEGAKLGGAHLEGADLSHAHLEGAKFLTEAQIVQAKLCHTGLPEGINLNPDRDCKELEK